ncbi:hypothetical protein DFJ73DRAFT_204988 [Zopfochytrium polystomum]|nr:hypothetical protein DFJ73DRAFT_204988 [Zopfochytrium polystomum]
MALDCGEFIHRRSTSSSDVGTVVTSCLRIYHPGMDFGDFFQLVYPLQGFARVYFRENREGSLVVFKNPHDACLAVLFNISKELKLVFHAPPQAPHALVHGGKPSSLIYVRLMKGMTCAALEKIVRMVPGVKSVQPAKTSMKVQFDNPEEASDATEWLWSKTNIYAHFHDSGEQLRAAAAAAAAAAQSASLPSSEASPSNASSVSPYLSIKTSPGSALMAFAGRRLSDVSGGTGDGTAATPVTAESAGGATMHVQNLDRNFAMLEEFCLSSLTGVSRMGFHQEYVFLCFNSINSAEVSLSIIQSRTRMKARLVPFAYAPHFTPGSEGTPGRIIKMIVATISPAQSELETMFRRHRGLQRLHFGPRKCWAVFDTTANASACKDYFNNRTNLRVVFCSSIKQQQQLQQLTTLSSSSRTFFC